MTDEVFEQRLRRDLRRLADGLVGASRPLGAAPGGYRRGSARRGRTSRGRMGRLAVAGWLAVAAALVASGVAAGQVLAPARGGPSVGSATSALAATAGVAAYVSGGTLYTAEPGSRPRGVARVGDSTSAPQWSADGAWLAYLDAGDQLHLVQADGGHPQVPLSAPVAAMTWSPAADLLAVVVSGGPQEGDLLLVPVSGSGAETPQVLATDVASFVWSPGGDHIAVSRAGTGVQPDRLTVVDVVTGAVQDLPYQAPPGDGVLLASWWPDSQGLLLWLEPGRSLAAEATGLPLVTVPLTAVAGTTLARTFVYLPWLVWAPNGSRLALVEMTRSFPWQGSRVAVCRPSPGTCRPLPQPAGTVSLDPTWSPDGRQLAVVRAPVLASGAPGPGLDAWYAQRRLWVVDPAGTAARPVAGAPSGAAEPRFGPGGTSLTVVTANAVVEVATKGGKATVLAGGLSGALDTAGPDGYGKLPWGGTVVWGP